jgi:outer membrane protein
MLLSKKIFSKCFALSLLALTCSTQASILSPMEHAATQPWNWQAGLATTFVNGIYKDSSGYKLIYPYVGYKGDRVTIAGPSAFVRLVGPSMFHVSFGGALLPDSFNPNRSTDLKMRLLNSREYSIGVGLQGSLTLQSLGLFNVQFLRAFVGGDGGFYGNASYTTMLTKGFGGLSASVLPSVGVQYYSDKLSNYYYGVSSAESTKSGIAAYTPGAGYQPYLGVGLMGEVKNRFRAVVSTKVAYLPDSVKNSPIISKRYATTTTLVLSMGF